MAMSRRQEQGWGGGGGVVILSSLPAFSNVLKMTEHFSTRILAQGAGWGERNMLSAKA